MQIGDLENLQEITIYKLSSVEGGLIAIADKPIADKIHIGDIRINPDYQLPIRPYCPPPPPLPCYPGYPGPLPSKDITVIPLRSCPVIL